MKGPCILGQSDTVFEIKLRYNPRNKCRVSPRNVTSTVYEGCISDIIPLWGGFRSSIARQARRVPTPNGTSPESSRRDASKAPTFLAPTQFQLLWRYRPWEIGPGGCDTHHTLDNGLLNMPIGMPIGWDIAYRYLWTPSIGMRICYNRLLFLTVEISTMGNRPRWV